MHSAGVDMNRGEPCDCVGMIGIGHDRVMGVVYLLSRHHEDNSLVVCSDISTPSSAGPVFYRYRPVRIMSSWPDAIVTAEVMCSAAGIWPTLEQRGVSQITSNRLIN